MNDDFQTPVKAPEEILSNPALLFLFYRIEQIFGIKTGAENLKNLNEYMEKTCGKTFIEDPASYECLLTSREKIHEISKYLTINETYFFREGSHFELLSAILPSYQSYTRPVQICSAASSIGCEAYSIAMLMDYYINKGLKFDFNIDAFDIDNESIEIAKCGRYSQNTIREDGNNWHYILNLYITLKNNNYIVSDKIKRKINFYPHNIMRGFEKKYDIIFFKNALIYFSYRNRQAVINSISDALYNKGLLFMGIPETSSVNHPLLSCLFANDVFYFQKKSNINEIEIPHVPIKIENNEKPKTNLEIPKKENDNNKNTRTYKNKKDNIHINYDDIPDIIKTDEGKQNADFVFNSVHENNTDSIFGSQLVAACIYFLNTQDFEKANIVLSFLEKNSKEACAVFLRGEYHLLLDNIDEAKELFKDTCYKDKYFWPAFYRLAVLAQGENQTKYEYKINKTIESIELCKKNKENLKNYYESFMGGFSDDYFIEILKKKLKTR